MRFGNAAAAATLILAVTACSVPKPETLDCTDGASVFECKSKFSDGKSRAIVFVEAAMPDQETLDERSTVDSFGNAYCVTLYKNATATFVPGECGAVQPEAVTTTTLDSAAILQSLACTDGGSIFECQGVFSDGSRRPLKFLDAPPAGRTALVSTASTDSFGNVYCVSAYDDATASFVPGEC